MSPESFFHVALKVRDIESCVSFYTESLDAEVIERGRAVDGSGPTAVNHVALSIADKRLYLFDEAPYEAAGLVDDVPYGFLHFGFVVDDVQQEYERLSAEGVHFLMEPAVFGTLKITFFTDPAGNRIELIEHR